MKYSRSIALLATICFFTLGTQKKAQAAIVLPANLTISVAMAAGGMAGMTVGAIWSQVNEDQWQWWSAILAAGMMSFVLGESPDEIESGLSSEFPRIPGHAIRDAALAIAETAKKTAPNPKGFKSVALKDSIANPILDSINYIDRTDLRAFAKVLKTPIEI